MSSAGVHERAGQLRRDRVPFVHARVIRAEKPTSAKPGDEALVLPGGTIEGFIGGTCAETTVRAQALAVLDSGETLLLRITPRDEGPEAVSSGIVVAYNPCLSGGALEIFLEPVVPPPLVVVHGDTPIARALLALGHALGYHMVTFSQPDSVHGATALVAASHGRGEEPALQAALDAAVPYVGLVASRRRGDAVLAAIDAPEGDKARVRTPAGLDIGAVSAEEVALSILAEIVTLRPRAKPALAATVTVEAPAPLLPDLRAADPVCGMEVAAVATTLHLDHDGRRHWFCGSGCLRAFSADPAAYAVSSGGSPRTQVRETT